MRSQPALAVVAVLVAVLAASSRARAQEDFDPRPERASGQIDPLLPAGTSALALGGTFLLAGAAFSGQSDGYEEQVCGLSGCADVEWQSDADAVPTMLLVGGGATAVGGAAMLLVGLAEPPERATAGRARVAAGGMGLAVGAGAISMGLVARGTASAGSGTDALIGAGVATSVISAPILAWGVGTLEEGERGDAYRSNGRIIAGSILTTAGIGLSSAGVAVLGSVGGCSGEFCGFGVIFAIPPLAMGAGALATGIPLFAGGADVEPGEALPELRIGAGDVSATWSFQ